MLPRVCHWPPYTWHSRACHKRLQLIITDSSIPRLQDHLRNHRFILHCRPSSTSLLLSGRSCVKRLMDTFDVEACLQQVNVIQTSPALSFGRCANTTSLPSSLPTRSSSICGTSLALRVDGLSMEALCSSASIWSPSIGLFSSKLQQTDYPSRQRSGALMPSMPLSWTSSLKCLMMRFGPGEIM